MNQKTAKILLVVAIIQTIAIIWLVYDRTQIQSQTAQLTENLTTVTDERDNVQKELQAMYDQYESLKSDNKTMNAELEAQQARISELMDEIKKTKRGNLSRIKELEAETETLRSIMKSYIKQIDSLNTQNIQLTSENKEVKKRYETEVTEKKTAITQRDSLNTTVKKAQALKSFNIRITPMNKRGKSTERARKMERIEVCFSIAENVVADKGKRNVYLRIAGPDNSILIGEGSKFFMFEGSEIAYSAVKTVDYQGEQTDVCIYWKATKEYTEGRYTVDIFADGKRIGTQSVELK